MWQGHHWPHGYVYLCTCADDRPDYPTVYGAYIPAGSIWEVQEGGTLEFKRDSADSGYSNPDINAGGKIVMDDGKLIFNTPYQLMQTVVEWEDGEEMTYEKVRDNITEPLVDGTGVIYFNDSESAAGEENGWIFDCYADYAAVAAEAVKDGNYDADEFDAMSWGLVCAIDLEHIDIERSWACDHTWDEGEVTTAPTCTKPGVKTYTCSKCQTTRTEEVGATGHTAVTDAAVAATCTIEGKTEGKHCSVCNTVIVAQETIPALGHDWSTNDCAVEATCTRCGATRAAGEHVWGGWTVTKAATCTEEGSRSHTCTSCGASESETIAAQGHAYQSKVTAPTCTEKGYTTHTCSRCGNSYQDSETATLGHDWGEWVVDKEATGTEDGSQHRNCSRCDAVETQTISKLPKQEVGWTIPDTITWTYGQVVSAQNTAYNDTADGGALTYSSSDESVATVDANGKATIVGAGTCEIIVTAARVPGKYAETSASYTLVINKAPLTVTANNASITYGQDPANAGWTASGFVYDDTAAGVAGTAVYSDTKLTDKITSVKLTKNMTVYAKWTEKGAENPFNDVAEDAYYADAVIWAVGEGITSGTTATTFTPNATCTRAQAVTFLWRASGSPAPKSSVNPFTDVKADAYYYDAVLWAVEQGITKGTSDTTFTPNATCTRAQIVTFLYRSAK